MNYEHTSSSSFFFSWGPLGDLGPKKRIPKFFVCAGLFFIVELFKTVKNRLKNIKFLRKGPKNFVVCGGFF